MCFDEARDKAEYEAQMISEDIESYEYIFNEYTIGVDRAGDKNDESVTSR